jgi:hypothetical protein
MDEAYSLPACHQGGLTAHYLFEHRRHRVFRGGGIRVVSLDDVVEQ